MADMDNFINSPGTLPDLDEALKEVGLVIESLTDLDPAEAAAPAARIAEVLGAALDGEEH